MTSFYIDVNALNAEVKDKTTNASWKYKLKEPLVLPANSEIAALTSFVNFKGIVGQAIDIKEDITEEFAMGYYMQDTFYEKPRASIISNDTNGVNSTLEDAYFRANYQTKSGQIQSNVNITVDEECGYTENPMPICGGIRQRLGNTLCVPLTVRVKIVIPKGVYSVQQISELITDQMNGRKIFDLGNKSAISSMVESGNYRGIPCNNVMSRTLGFQTEAALNGYLASNTFVDKELAFNSSFFPMATEFQFGNITDFSTDGRTVNAISDPPGFLPVCVGLRPKVVSSLFDVYKNMAIDKTDGTPTFSSTLTNPPNLTQTGGTTNLSFGCIVNTAAQASTGDPLTALNDTREYCLFIDRPDPLTNQPFNIYDEGFITGTTNFKLGFSQEAQLFTLEGLGQLRKEPTNDNIGNEMPDPSKTVVYERRISNNITTKTVNSGTITSIQEREVHSTLSKPMSRISGTYIYNWGVSTAKRLRTNFDLAGTSADDYKSFEDFFNTEEEARLAWQETLWFRLGFQYDQIQKTSSWGTSRFFMDQPESNVGFTTDSILDDGAIPFVSTMYSNQDYTQPTKTGAPVIPKGQIFARPNVSNMQTFNLLDVNVPSISLKNNNTPQTEGDPTVAPPDTTPCVLPYNSSFFSKAVMLPILTTEIPKEADKLPQLSQDGYLIITSPTFQNNDQISRVSPVCLLDILPLSALSNQDFVSDKNELVHILTNEKIVEYIEIRILRPDLTEPILDENSSVLLKITIPNSPTPNLLANASLESFEEQITQSITDPKKIKKK